jgi:hypothetical protein
METVRTLLKSFILYVILAIYTIFIPFLFVNCASVDDTSYIVEEEVERDADAQLAVCQQREFLTADCVEILQAEEERLADEEATLALAETAAELATDCMEGTASTNGASDSSDSEDETTTACVTSDDADALTAALDVCLESTTADTDTCAGLNDLYDGFIADCNENNPELDDEFCTPLIAYDTEPAEDRIDTD